MRDVTASLKGAAELIQYIRHDCVDIVHANTFKAALVGSLACISTSRPLIFHDRIHLTHGLLGRFVALAATRIIAVSGSVGSKHGALVRSKVRVIPSGIDVTRPRTVRTEPGPPRICYLGRISEEKALERLIDSAPMVLEEIPDARFVIGGAPFTPTDELYLDGLRQRIRALDLSDRFEFPGYVGDITAFFGSCDILILPSRKEPLGRVMLEAMAAKKPVIAYDTGGPAEVISNRETGILVEPGSISGLAAAAISLLEDTDLRRRIGEKACRVVVENYASDKITARIMEVYDEITGG
jgi:glycosyltransferase involved in cell wall biosynthesis